MEDRFKRALECVDDYEPTDFEDVNMYLRRLSYVNDDYNAVKNLMWSKMTYQDGQKGDETALIRVLTDLPSSSFKLWAAVQNFDDEVEEFRKRIDQTAGWISHKILWDVTVYHSPDPMFLPMFEALYEDMRVEKYGEDVFKNTQDEFSCRLIELPSHINELIHTAKTSRESHIISGTFKVDESTWIFQFEDTSDYDWERWHNPWITFSIVVRPVNK